MNPFLADTNTVKFLNQVVEERCAGSHLRELAALAQAQPSLGSRIARFFIGRAAVPAEPRAACHLETENAR